MASTLPAPGRAKLAPMLSETGTAQRRPDGVELGRWALWWIMGSYYLRAWHMRWFNDHMDGWRHGAGSGRRILRLCRHRPEIASGGRKTGRTRYLGPEIHGLAEIFDIGLVRARVARMSVTGEKGYEINCRYGDHIKLRRMLLEAGADEGIREVRLQRDAFAPGSKRALASGRRNSPKPTRRA